MVKWACALEEGSRLVPSSRAAAQRSGDGPALYLRRDECEAPISPLATPMDGPPPLGPRSASQSTAPASSAARRR
jgi:hypothetical protein